MDIKNARKIVKMIKGLDVILWGLPYGELHESMNNARYNLWKSLSLGGWNFDSDYKVHPFKNEEYTD